jgi:hypothetical protein
MAKRQKNRQHNGQKRGTNNTMAKREEQTTQWQRKGTKEQTKIYKTYT